ncbi:hypothetical protein B9G69_009650 [Bdellovibrio sp. SKB1291214]|uniref:hypothetical protein n=1 Tax=Bdellovibrio sp. SKB1291214 TaxID=1732569 RepID=UPI000B5159B0|nr:hypothetical protein [Bdellovibrio sp. SKB1291214]UYL07309.1 hypothetical protein B9G69_009650 [Bdellovibrio sp. SKB1291214]
MKKYFIVGLFLVLAGCASKEQKEVKNNLEYLNGKTYGVDPGGVKDARTGSVYDLTGIPVTGTKNQTTRIRGTLMQGEGITATPLKYTKVRLLDDDGVTVGEATSDIQGKFILSGIFFNGHYTVDVASSKFSGATRVYVNSYDQEITVHVKPAQ